jgi:hypothetical protein
MLSKKYYDFNPLPERLDEGLDIERDGTGWIIGKMGLTWFGYQYQQMPMSISNYEVGGSLFCLEVVEFT